MSRRFPLLMSSTIMMSLLLCFLATCDGSTLQRTLRHRRDDVRYGVLMDAGSSSTKVKVYSYTPGQAPTFVPQVTQKFSVKMSPGISAFIHASDQQLKEHVQTLLLAPTKVLGSTDLSSTPVYMMATAGLRTLSPQDAKSLVDRLRSLMRQPDINPFKFQDDYFSILSGEEEAVYAWVAVNYLNGFFSSPMTRNDSVGLMEMGGGSMQVAFLPDGPLLQEEFQIYVGKKRFDLYAQSYLNFGGNYMKDMVLWRLWKDAETSDIIEDLSNPCMLKGDNRTYTPEDGISPIRVKGTGSYADCEDVLKRILLPQPDDPPCAPAPCAIGDRYQPSVEGMRFYAISAFIYAPQAMGAIGSDGKLDIRVLREKGTDYCSKTLDEVIKSGVREQYASDECQQSAYIPILITNALGFSDTTTAITAQGKINGDSIDWGLGAMVQQLSMSFLEEPFLECRRNNNTMPIRSSASVDADNTGSA